MKNTLFLLSAVCTVWLAAAQCPGPKALNDPECPSQTLTGSNKCCTWNLKYNNESIYDRSLNFVSNTRCRPLGFAFATWYYQPATSINQPCVTVTCTDTPCYVQLAVETSPPSNLCVQDNKGGDAVCQQGSFRSCSRMKDTTVTYTFSCQIGCGESNVDFWYRFKTLTPMPGEDGNDKCNDETVEYPSSLAQLPDNRDPRNNNPVDTVTRPNSSSGLAPLLSICATALLFLLL